MDPGPHPCRASALPLSYITSCDSCPRNSQICILILSKKKGRSSQGLHDYHELHILKVLTASKPEISYSKKYYQSHGIFKAKFYFLPHQTALLSLRRHSLGTAKG